MTLSLKPRAAEVRLEGIGKRYGQVQAVKPLDLAIAGGTLVTLLGPSGCGKTTLLRMIAGLEQASEGRLFIGGRDVTLLPAGERLVWLEDVIEEHVERLFRGMEIVHLTRFRVNRDADFSISDESVGAAGVSAGTALAVSSSSSMFSGVFHRSFARVAYSSAKSCSFSDAASLPQTAGGGSQMPSSFFNSSISWSHRLSQYTVIKLLALPPHLSAQGMYCFSLSRLAAESRNGAPMAANPVIGSPRFANSKAFTTISYSTRTGIEVMQ